MPICECDCECGKAASFHGFGKHLCWKCYSTYILQFQYVPQEMDADPVTKSAVLQYASEKMSRQLFLFSNNLDVI